MSSRSENFTTNQNSKNVKSIPEMSWEEILALPAQNVPNKKIVEFRKKEAAGAKRKNK